VIILLYFLTALHLVVGIFLIGSFLMQKKKTLIYLHIGIGALAIGAGMLAMLVFLLFWART